jgi:hypothetical protein
MSGVTPLIDTLLATRLAQRVDLVPLKGQTDIAGPDAVTHIEKVTNDVRLPSRAGMLQQLGVGLLKAGDSSQTAVPARAGENVTLSTAARTVSAILDVSSGATHKITGTEPLWLKAQPPLAPVLSATLARTVANSGLFYESHLAQFAAGTRTLAQLAQEPQARLDATVKVALALPVAEAAGQGAGVSGMAASTGLQVEAAALPGAAPVSLAADDAASIDSGKPGGGAASLANSVPGGGPASSPDAAPLSHSSDPAHLHKNAYESIQNAEGQEPAAKNHGASATDAARSNGPGLAGIHPDAVALVRQQLELLAVPVFRWSGEAWPGVPMDWEIHEKAQEDQNKRQAAADNEAVPRTWSTRVALTLPTLKDIEVRISLVGTALQVHLAASENTTRNLLGEARTELPKRLGELGLQLTGLQIGLLAAPSASQAMPEADDARK